MLRGSFTLSLGTDTTAALDWNADPAVVRTELEGLNEVDGVRVTSDRLTKYGTYTWTITYVENAGNVPTGAGDVDDLTIVPSFDETASLGSAQFHQNEDQKGSTPMSGDFQITFDGTTSGNIDFDESATNVAAALNSLITTGEVHVTRAQTGAGWDDVVVTTDGTPGGYRWDVTFIDQNGNFLPEGRRFPFGSGDANDLQPTNNLGGTGADVDVEETLKGSTAFDGSYAVSYNGASSGSILYRATELEFAQAITDIVGVGEVSATRKFRMGQALPGTVTVHYGDDFAYTSEDLRGVLRRGDPVRIGGGDAAVGGSVLAVDGTNGDVRLSQSLVSLAAGSDTLVFADSIRGELFTGDTVRIRGVEYVVADANIGIQTIDVTSSVVIDDGAEFELTYDASVLGCVRFDSTAAQLETFINTAGPVPFHVSVVKKPSTTTSATWVLYFDDADWVTEALFSISSDFNAGACTANTATPAPSASVTQHEVGALAANEITISPAYSGKPLEDEPVYWVAPVFTVADSGTFTDSVIPLALETDSSSSASYFRIFANTNAFRVNGFLYTVTYTSFLGNTLALGASPGTLLGTNVTLTSTDNVVPSILPLSREITGLQTGVPYFVRVAATNGVGTGYFDTDGASARPTGTALTVENLDVEISLNYNEVQKITTGATHRDEVQSITTSADRRPEIQVIRTSAAEGATISGTFEVTFGGISTGMKKLALSSVGTEIGEYGEFTLNYASAHTTSCMPFDVDASTLQGEINTVFGVHATSITVEVFRVGDASATYDFGYTHIIVVTSPASDVPDITVSSCAGSEVVFDIEVIDAFGTNVDFDADANDLAEELLLLPTMGGDVIVTETPMDAQSGTAWTVAFVALPGNVDLMSCDATGLSPGSAACAVTVQEDGNVLGGEFTITLGGQSTSTRVDHDASAADVKAMVESIQTGRTVTVTRSEADMVEGYTWYITFNTDEGDVPDIIPVNSLTGTGATITVAELTKGNWLSGNFLVSMPGYVDEATFALDMLPSAAATALTNLQAIGAVTVERSSATTEYGHVWTVTFIDLENDGDVDSLVAEYVDTLLGDGAVARVDEVMKGSQESDTRLLVSFDPPLSNQGGPITRYRIEWALDSGFTNPSVTYLEDRWVLLGEQTITVDSNDVALPTGTFRLQYGLDTENGELTEELSATATALEVRTALEALEGVETVSVRVSSQTTTATTWAVTFLKVTNPNGPRGLLVGRQDLSPAAATINIVGSGCNRCVQLTGLDNNLYRVRVSAYNYVGWQPLASAAIDMERPQMIPTRPLSVTAEAIAGTELEVSWFPPQDNGNSDIISYCIEYDNVVEFNSGSDDTCGGNALGAIRVTGASIAGAAPYKAVLDSLTPDTLYYVRIVAENSVPFQVTAHDSNPPSNRRWSDPVSGVPQYLKPTAPVGPTLQVIAGDWIRVSFYEPARIGGRTLDGFGIEWDTVSGFNSQPGSEPLGVEFVAVGDLEQVGEMYYYDIRSLVTGTYYYVRVRAHVNDVDLAYGPYATTTPVKIAPVKPASAPTSLSTSVAVEQATPIDKIEVTWDTPAEGGGSAITRYYVEWWNLEERREVVRVRLTNTDGAAQTTGQFNLNFLGESTIAIDHDASAVQMRHALMTLSNTPVIGHVEVTRTTVGSPITGYDWYITFMSDLDYNFGNVPFLVKNDGSLNGGTGTYSLTVSEVTRGVRPGGNEEVQQIYTDSSSTVDGYFRVRFAGTTNGNIPIEWSAYLPHDISAGDFEAVLENLASVGQVTVARSVADAGNDAYSWLITFHSAFPDTLGTGNIPAIVVDDDMITGASLEVNDGLPDVTQVDPSDASLLCEECVPYERPLEYGYDITGSSTHMYIINGLTAGYSYTVRVTALNARGLGVAAVETNILLPLQAPQPPQNLAVTTSPGRNDQLLVYYDAPASDGGTAVTKYLIQWDTDSEFTHAFGVEYRCPNNPRYELKVVTLTPDSGILNGGTFRFRYTLNGVTDETIDIDFDAVATAAEETEATGVYSDSPVTAGSVESALEGLDNIVSVRVAREVRGSDGRIKLRITFLDEGDAGTLQVVSNALSTSTADTVTPSIVTESEGEVYTSCLGPQPINGLVQGTQYYIRVFAYNKIGFSPQADTGAATYAPVVPPGRPTSVSVLPYSGTQLVVKWNSPLDNGGATIEEYKIEVDTSDAFGNPIVLSRKDLSAGEPYVLYVSGLTTGVPYYVRISARNFLPDFGLPQLAPAPVAPATTPSAARNARALITSGRAGDGKITVTWEAPAFDGGAEIQYYVVKWDVVKHLNSLTPLPHKGEVTVYPEDDASVTISSLTVGRQYFVQVYAHNNMGSTALPTSISVTPTLRKLLPSLFFVFQPLF